MNKKILNAPEKLRREFIDRPETKEYVTINTSVNSMNALLKKALSGDVDNKVALDQALITMFNKLTDPNSVVRESEYARTPQNLPIINRIQGAIQKIQKGGAGLTNKDREALVLGAKIIADERGKTYNTTRQEYEDLSTAYDLDSNITLRGMKEHINFIDGNQQSNTFTTEDEKRLQELEQKFGK